MRLAIVMTVCWYNQMCEIKKGPGNARMVSTETDTVEGDHSNATCPEFAAGRLGGRSWFYAIADGAGPHNDIYSPSPNSYSHSHADADYKFDMHCDNGERVRKQGEMSHEGAITVTFGNVKRKFKMGTTCGQVLKNMSQQFPPHGALLHVGDEGLVVTSQEEILSQKEYIYEHPNLNAPSTNMDGLDPKLLDAVLRLQLAKGGQLVTYGSTVVFNREGMCLTALHFLEAAGITTRSRSLRVGGHVAKTIAVDVDIDIACLEITDGDGSNFDFISLDYTMSQNMKIHLIFYPAMVDEFKNLMPTITHGQVANVINNFQCVGDYACFPNSSGGAIVSNNRLVGIHVEENYFEEKSKKTKVP